MYRRRSFSLRKFMPADLEILLCGKSIHLAPRQKNLRRHPLSLCEAIPLSVSPTFTPTTCRTRSVRHGHGEGGSQLEGKRWVATEEEKEVAQESGEPGTGVQKRNGGRR